MISLDADYIALKPYLEAECKRRKLDFRYTELNPTGWGDMMFISELTGIHNVEIKQAGEYIGDTDHVINQIKAQAEMSDYLWLFIYGEMRPSEEGYSYSLRPQSAKVHLNAQGIEYAWSQTYKRYHHRVKWDGQRKILWRFREVGVQVVEVRNLEELASELCLLYEAAQTEGSTFTRLIKEKIRIPETDPAKALFMRQLMGLEAGIGEEVADAIATWMRDGKKTLSVASLITELIDISLIAQPLRSGKRTIGPAAVQRLKTALGI